MFHHFGSKLPIQGQIFRVLGVNRGQISMIHFITPKMYIVARFLRLLSRVYFKDFLDSTTLPPLPSPALPSSPLPYPPLPSLPLPLEVGPLNTARGLGSAVSSGSSSARSGAEPAEFLILVHFSLKIWHLVATVLMIFVIINWPNFVQKQYTESSDTASWNFITLWQVYLTCSVVLCNSDYRSGRAMTPMSEDCIEWDELRLKITDFLK